MLSEVVVEVVGLTQDRWDAAYAAICIVLFSVGLLVAVKL